ncbi:hypothetical protein [Stutzerimonas stutzeri]|uniref:hypothetical protein n=1 Tax=Stutzerimonas stutzeri TaxID=316 RepID=UPI0030A851E6
MAELQYDICSYLASVRMSSKIRVLVEGKDDRPHVTNVINYFCNRVKFKVDVASDIKGDCKVTSKNNRAKIEKIHSITKDKAGFSSLVFLCDRETRGFSISAHVRDDIGGHYVDGSLSWTMGHSLENYFINSVVFSDGLRYLTASAFKDDATAMFIKRFESAVKLVARLTLAAEEFGNASYPCGIISWRNLRVGIEENVAVDFSGISNPAVSKFQSIFDSYGDCVEASSYEVCLNLCRGHTALVVLKRIYARCLYEAARSFEEKVAEYEANLFDNISESLIANALSEAWIKRLGGGEVFYPAPLVDTVHAVAS